MENKFPLASSGSDSMAEVKIGSCFLPLHQNLWIIYTGLVRESFDIRGDFKST